MINEIFEKFYDTIPDYFSRHTSNQVIKNVVRFLLRERFNLTYFQICDYEQQRYNTRPNHATIINSVERTKALHRDFTYQSIMRGLEAISREVIARHERDLPALRGEGEESVVIKTLSFGDDDVSGSAHGEQPTES